MTAPLPSVKEYLARCGVGTAWIGSMIETEMKAYAALAVRQALERAKEAMYEQGAEDRAACAAICRSMIEEYRDDTTRTR